MIIERDKYLNDLLEWKDKDIVKIVTGPRRSGKTFLLFNLFASELLKLGVLSQNIIQINLELEENKKLRKSLNLLNFIKEQIINENKYYVLIDEIQNVKNFEDLVNSLLNIKNVDLYITGSNSKFLSRDIKTQIRGRATEIKVRPLTFKEFYSVKKELGIEEAFKEYLTFGGMPFLVDLNYESKKKYLKELFETTYINDIVERNKITSDEDLQEFVDFLASNVGSLTNSLNICNTYKTLKQNNITYFTIDKYLKNLSHAYLIDLVQLFNLKGKSIIKRLNKIYFYDLGIRNSRIGYNNIEMGHAIENIVYNELVTRNYDVNIGLIKVREKNKDNQLVTKNLEIDFVASKYGEELYVQVVDNLENSDILKREIKPLLKLKNNYPKLILYRTKNIDIDNVNGIKLKSIYDFLLEK